jgi:hypothetical protein
MHLRALFDASLVLTAFNDSDLISLRLAQITNTILMVMRN